MSRVSKLDAYVHRLQQLSDNNKALFKNPPYFRSYTIEGDISQVDPVQGTIFFKDGPNKKETFFSMREKWEGDNRISYEYLFSTKEVVADIRNVNKKITKDFQIRYEIHPQFTNPGDNKRAKDPHMHVFDLHPHFIADRIDFTNFFELLIDEIFLNGQVDFL